MPREKPRIWLKSKNSPCPHCGQHYSRQKLGLHIKERHPGKKEE